MSPNIEVSVIIPTYNRRATVVRAVRSVLAQSRAVDEIIVVDDGSTDGTADELHALFGDSVRVLRQPNRGVSAARNQGLATASGRLLALLDSDDSWSEHKIELQCRWLQARPDFGMVLCDYERTESHGHEVRAFRRREAIPEDGWVLPWVLQQPSLAPSSAMFRREVFQQVGGFDEALPTAEDIDFHIRVAARFRIGVIEEVLMHAHMQGDGLSTLERSYDDYVQVLQRSIDRLGTQVPEPLARRALAQAYLRNARGQVIWGQYREAYAMACRAWAAQRDGRLGAQIGSLAGLAVRSALARLTRAAGRR